MAIADVSIRPNSIRFRDAVRLVHERVMAAAGDSDAPDKDGEARALRELWEGSGSEQRAQRHQATRARIMWGLLTGSLRAHFSDATEAKDIPGWAWEGGVPRSELWMGGCLVLPALLPEEWQRWSGDSVFLAREHFDGWLAAQDFGAPVASELPDAFDAADRPEPVTHLAPAERPFVTLSEALTWIAFGTSFANERLIRAIDELAFGPAAATNRILEEAVAKLTTLASDRAIEIRGKYIEHACADESAELTSVIEPIRFHDFAQFDLFRDALRSGVGLTWVRSELGSELSMSKRSDFYQSVTVNRTQLLRHFPLRAELVAPQAHSDAVQPMEWSDFGEESTSELQGLQELASLDMWWSWPEAIAWVGSRSCRNVATLRYWAKWWTSQGDDDPTITIAAQAEIANRFCKSPLQAKASLINAIERGAVTTAGRDDRHGKSEPIASGDWRGGTVVYADGGAQLVSAKNRMVCWAFDIAVCRTDLLNEFPASQTFDPSDLSTSSGGVTYALDEQPPTETGHVLATSRAPGFKAGRAPSDDKILELADMMRARGMTGYELASRMRHEPGFENVCTTQVRDLIKGRWKSGRRKSNPAP